MSVRKTRTIIAILLPLFFAAAARAQNPPVTTLAALRAAAAETRAPRTLGLDATVLFADAANGRIILRGLDASDTAEILTDFPAQTFSPGDRIRISGDAALMNHGCAIELAPPAVIDNDGIHDPLEKSAVVHLDAGRHPIRVDCFNASNISRLRFEYAKPAAPGATIAARAPVPVSDLRYRAYRKRLWMLPPNRNAGTPVAEGAAAAIDNTIIAGREYMGVVFEGTLEITTPGDYTFFLESDDGSRLVIGAPSLRIEKLPPVPLPAPLRLFAGQQIGNSGGGEYLWATVEGRASRASHAGSEVYLWLDSGAGQVRVEVANPASLPPPRLLLHNTVRMTGVVRRGLTLDGVPQQETLYVQDAAQIKIIPAAHDFTPVAEIERIDRALLGDGKPPVRARIRGVVTRVVSSVAGIVLQDESRGIYVNLEHLPAAPVQTGELLEITGDVEPGEFSPFIIATSITRRGAGIMPAPIRASREELTNGSLHSQYVEIEGYVLAADPRTLTLRTRAGVLLVETETETSPAWLNAVVRMRGCLRVFWDTATRRINTGRIGLDYAEISIDRPAPAGLFAASPKKLSDLRMFDPNAQAFQRIRIAGQLVFKNGGELCLMDETRGFRATLAPASSAGDETLAPGDLVEIAGFPEFDGPSPHIDRAIARKLGAAPLPPPRTLSDDALLRDDYDSTRVTVDADLLDLVYQDNLWTLQLRAGPDTFRARLAAPVEKKPAYAPGSRLRLAGVYRGLGGNRNLDQPIGAFELMLASDADVRVLATPPWWTLPRLLALIGILTVILALALLWITSLRRQVARQTAQLETVLEERHRVEQTEALAKERSRLAYDLHDELGAGLSEIGMMSSLVATPSLAREKRHAHLSRLADTARRLIASLDEIVWAVNPRYDPVSSFASYYTTHAQQFLELASLRCRLDIADDLPPHPLTSRVRHTLFLAFKETLTNVAKHARATEVVIRIFTETAGGKTWLAISVSDDGRGIHFSNTRSPMPGRDGLASIAARLRALDGLCDIAPVSPHGTRVTLKVPLA